MALSDTIKNAVIYATIGAVCGFAGLFAGTYIGISRALPANNNPQAFNPAEAHYKIEGDITVMNYKGKKFDCEIDKKGMPKYYEIKTLTVGDTWHTVE